MLAQLFVLLLIVYRLSFQIFCQQSVHHHVRVPADGRGEVCVMPEGEAIVADVVSGIDRFGHGAQGEGLDDVLLLLSRDLFHQFVHCCRETLDVFSVNLIAEPFDEITERAQFLRIRLVMDTIHKGFSFQFSADKFCHTPVGKQHKLFYQLVGGAELAKENPQGNSLFIQIEPDFKPLKGERAGGETSASQQLCQVIERQQLFMHVTLAGVNNLLGFTVREAPV